jgi:hypothetical protein
VDFYGASLASVRMWVVRGNSLDPRGRGRAASGVSFGCDGAHSLKVNGVIPYRWKQTPTNSLTPSSNLIRPHAPLTHRNPRLSDRREMGCCRRGFCGEADVSCMRVSRSPRIGRGGRRSSRYSIADNSASKLLRTAQSLCRSTSPFITARVTNMNARLSMGHTWSASVPLPTAAQISSLTA